MKIELHPRFIKRIKSFSADERQQLSQVLGSLIDGFGHPYVHAGLGIRRLRKDLFECRAGERWRIVLFAERGILTAYDVMTHDVIRSWLRKF